MVRLVVVLVLSTAFRHTPLTATMATTTGNTIGTRTTQLVANGWLDADAITLSWNNAQERTLASSVLLRPASAVNTSYQQKCLKISFSRAYKYSHGNRDLCSLSKFSCLDALKYTNRICKTLAYLHLRDDTILKSSIHWLPHVYPNLHYAKLTITKPLFHKRLKTIFLGRNKCLR